MMDSEEEEEQTALVCDNGKQCILFSYKVVKRVRGSIEFQNFWLELDDTLHYAVTNITPWIRFRQNNSSSCTCYFT